MFITYNLLHVTLLYHRMFPTVPPNAYTGARSIAHMQAFQRKITFPTTRKVDRNPCVYI